MLLVSPETTTVSFIVGNPLARSTALKASTSNDWTPKTIEVDPFGGPVVVSGGPNSWADSGQAASSRAANWITNVRKSARRIWYLA